MNLPGSGRYNIEKRFGSLDILVNNAGIQYTANIEDFPADKWDAIIAITDQWLQSESVCHS